MSREWQVWRAWLPSMSGSGAFWVVVRDEGESHLMLCLDDSSGDTIKLDERALATGSQLMDFLKWDRIA